MGRERLELPEVTLVAAASVNVAATLTALRHSRAHIDFASALLFTDDRSVQEEGVTVVGIDRLDSAEAYSRFMLQDLVRYVETSHCLVVQWDGYVLDPHCWDPTFLDHDYIGASWPQFSDGLDVGNGGFSLRSRRLLEACLDPAFVPDALEDVAICRTNRRLLEDQHAIRFADRSVADRFAFERTPPAGPTFGFHGVFNMVPVGGAQQFWHAYLTLDDRRTLWTDYGLLSRQLARSPRGLSKVARMAIDRAVGGKSG